MEYFIFGVDWAAKIITGGALLYSVVLSLFRHSVHEDKGLLDSLRDIMKYTTVVFLMIKMTPLYPHMGDYKVILDAIIIYIVQVMLSRTFTKYVSGVEPKKVKCDGKVYIITGCNTGIGFETARMLTEWGGTVVMACRSVKKAEEARQVLLKETKCAPSKLLVMELDLCSFRSVRDFVKNFNDSKLPLNCLINNAGVMMAARESTADGHEAVFQANHLAHFLLTQMLLPNLNSTNGRIVVLSSALHKVAGAFDFDDCMSDKRYSLFGTYSQAKLANVMFAVELQRRLEILKKKTATKFKMGIRITCNVVHPGCVRTEVTRNMSSWVQMGNYLAAPIMMLLQKTPAQGAYCSVFAATSASIVDDGGGYYFHCQKERASPHSKDEEANKRLWELSEELTQSNKDTPVKAKANGKVDAKEKAKEKGDSNIKK
jgi:retinol dehydrogenase 12